MVISAASARSFIRSASSIRSSAARLAPQAKPKSAPSPSPSLFSKPKPTSQRIFRSPVPMSCCVESLMPFHSANSSALLISKLGVSRQPYGWLLEARRKRVGNPWRPAFDKWFHKTDDCDGLLLSTDSD